MNRTHRLPLFVASIAVAGFSMVAALSRTSAATPPGASAAPPGAAAPLVVGNPATHPPIGFNGGATSVDALVEQFVDAIERQDIEAMHRLRVTKDEYMQIIVPGTVAPGMPPRQVSEQPRELFWSVNDRKSRYLAEAIAHKFGGKHYESHALRFSYGTKQYLWYTAQGQVRLDMRLPDDANIYELRTGSIAEVDGRYKFLAFQWDE